MVPKTRTQRTQKEFLLIAVISYNERVQSRSRRGERQGTKPGESCRPPHGCRPLPLLSAAQACFFLQPRAAAVCVECCLPRGSSLSRRAWRLAVRAHSVFVTSYSTEIPDLPKESSCSSYIRAFVQVIWTCWYGMLKNAKRSYQ